MSFKRQMSHSFQVPFVTFSRSLKFHDEQE
jgi:hypothetical protein